MKDCRALPAISLQTQDPTGYFLVCEIVIDTRAHVRYIGFSNKDKQLEKYITVYPPEQERSYGGQNKPAMIHWSSIGGTTVEDAREFVKALQDAIDRAEKMNQTVGQPK